MAVAFAFLLLLPVLIDCARRPTFRRLAVRNVSRRRGEAALVVVGATLGTAIITASFVVGDTFDASLSASARTQLGPVDEVVAVTQLDDIATTVSKLTTPPLPGTDGVLDLVATNAAAATIGADRKAVDQATLLEVDFDRARSFGGDAAATGMAGAGATPTGDEVVLSERVARKLGSGAGSRIELFAYGASKVFTVRAVVAEVGIAGFGLPGTNRIEVITPIFVPAGTIAEMAAAGTAPGQRAGGAQPPVGLVFVSNSGGVFDGAPASDAVSAEINERLGDTKAVVVTAAKKDLLDGAKRQGDSLSQLYSGIGFFSVAAGLLLLVNLFVMLSEERKTELGMLRALGFKRNHIMRSFAIEGAIYSVSAGLLGAGLGVFVGFAITLISSSIFANGRDQLAMQLSAKPATVLLGMCTGMVISLFTVYATSFFISRFNIILAIRDLPKAAGGKRGAWGVVFGLIGCLAGALLTMRGLRTSNAMGVLVGPALVCFSAMPLLSRILSRKLVTIALSGVVVVWTAGIYAFLPGVVGRPNINTFVVSGLILVTGAVVLFTSFDRVWSALASAVSATGRGLSVRLGLAYPLSRRFRTSLLLGMFSLVIFTMTFLSAVATIFGATAPRIVREIDGGWDIYVDTNPGNPAGLDQLKAEPGVGDAATIVRAQPKFTTPFQTTPRGWTAAGFDETFLAHGTPRLGRRDDRFADDRAAFDAVLKDGHLAIVPSFFLQGGGAGPPQNVLSPGDHISLINPATNEAIELTVAGVIEQDFLRNGVMVNRDTLAKGAGQLSAASRAFVKVSPGTNANEEAARLQGALVANGARARTFSSEVEDSLATQQGFFNLMRGYLGLGLIIGVAGLGVVMVRAVRERRRQIGMLRAMGFPSGVVRRAFLFESTFVALQGILLGVALGLLTSYQMLANSDAFGDQRLPFEVPWIAVAVIVAVPLFGSLIAAAVPATQASRIKPAVALRIAD